MKLGKREQKMLQEIEKSCVVDCHNSEAKTIRSLESKGMIRIISVKEMTESRTRSWNFGRDCESYIYFYPRFIVEAI